MNDILLPIIDEDIPKLQKLYNKQLPRNTHAYNYLHSVIRWKKLRPNENHITLFAPHGNWKNGTFVGIHKIHCHELFVSTLEDTEILEEALQYTKRIKWAKILIFAVHSDCHPTIKKVLEKQSPQTHSSICDVWWLPAETASRLEIDCPPEVYIDKLKPNHAILINSLWPHRYENSDNYIAKMIELNGGYGVFLKTDGTLVAWVLRNLLGLAILQTADKYKRKGYGSLITKALAKQMGKEGLSPIGTVLQNNVGSQKMFAGLGFEILESVVFIEVPVFRTNSRL